MTLITYSVAFPAFPGQFMWTPTTWEGTPVLAREYLSDAVMLCGLVLHYLARACLGTLAA